MQPEYRTKAYHQLARSLIMGLFALYMTGLAKTDSLGQFVESGAYAGIKLSAIALYAMAACQLYAAISLLRGDDIQADCDCGAHSPGKAGPLQWAMYALFLLPLLLGMLPDQGSPAGWQQEKGIHDHGGSQPASPPSAPVPEEKADLQPSPHSRS
ncbi:MULTISPECIES: DUF1980 domain-containing protein [unclassified Paenibacillus]|uniref:DUF1980 domain-containing protein n=1 Tax=unclassified Paenibacillus TaxID=185978 RepID=UPI000954589F|nr:MULTISPECIES: DUF1980 domain-containing protein [unclassified Paenibacillus]ASS66711.1 DUF1980 domain-containing protein [Paenibacillus sp. RUD330]SIP97908.1 protein of unknown function [Paenibacillus sp. RU4X]SIQ16606.1 protein of unknown function [Paenibacillus sp. RU4T]